MYTGTKIWYGDVNSVDGYVDFKTFFKAKQGKVYLNLSCDGNFTAYVNGWTAAFGETLNFPGHKRYYRVDITKYCSEENELSVTVWHYGDDSQTYINSAAYLMFEITQGGCILAQSDENTLARGNPFYRSGYAKRITPQLGFSYFYDSTKDGEAPYFPCTVLGKDRAEKIKLPQLKILKRPKIEITEREDGYLIDLGRETAGFLEMDFFAPEEETLTVSYGEHIRDGGVRQKADGRDFSVEYRAKKGCNRYLNTFRRIAGRYLQIDSKRIEIGYIGIRPVVRPIRLKKVTFADELTKKIYEVCVHTLRCCMHEHYEDCPWREQALYTLDSRNQMLCGYYAFEGFDYQRENILLINKGLRKEGLLNLCFPAVAGPPIPFFSLVYIIQVYEYVRYSGDASILPKVKKTLETIAATFDRYRDETGLIADFPNPFWNFFEWNEGSDGYSGGEGKKYSLILNCAYVYALNFYGEMFGMKKDFSSMKERIKETFFDAEKGLYKLSTEGKKYSRLGNSFAILIGLGGETLAEKLLHDETLIPETLSMTAFFYDALLVFGDKYKKFILGDIRKRYKKMLDCGATTFWETEKGEADFGGAGSLCHGWSAAPVYYFHLLGAVKNNTEKSEK